MKRYGCLVEVDYLNQTISAGRQGERGMQLSELYVFFRQLGDSTYKPEKREGVSVIIRW
jgi:hypothetical protein